MYMFPVIISCKKYMMASCGYMIYRCSNKFPDEMVKNSKNAKKVKKCLLK